MTNDITEKRKSIIENYGKWTAHNIKLADDIYTIDKDFIDDRKAINCILQIIADNAKKKISDARILDLGCLEGMYSIELGLHGAEVVGIEGRQANIVKARFAKECLGLENITFIQDDVLNVSPEKYGYFDIILCCGILYHLNTPDVFKFLENMGEMCTGFTIIDTHYGEAEEYRKYNEKQYWGRIFQEFNEETKPEDKEKSLWAALHNNQSFWFTPYSLFNLLKASKYTSVYQCFIPIVPGQHDDRFMLLAHKNKGINTKLTTSNETIEEYPF